MEWMPYPWMGAPAEPSDVTRDIALAQARYGFDRPTAQRLAFVRWLWCRGRLGDR